MSIFSPGETLRLAEQCLWVRDKPYFAPRMAYRSFPTVFGGDVVRRRLVHAMAKHGARGVTTPTQWVVPEKPWGLLGEEMDKPELEINVSMQRFTFFPLPVNYEGIASRIALLFPNRDQVEEFEKIRLRHEKHWREENVTYPVPIIGAEDDDKPYQQS